MQSVSPDAQLLSRLQAQLGLAHAYSRAKVKFNVNRVDNMIIQAIALLDTLDKDINTFVMRVREWYSWHFPELVKIVNDNYQYSKLALLIKDKGSLTEDKVTYLLCTVAVLIVLLSCHTSAMCSIGRSCSNASCCVTSPLRTCEIRHDDVSRNRNTCVAMCVLKQFFVASVPISLTNHQSA
jgi:RNA processing factor Prp31